MEIGWIGIGRMGFPMVQRLLKAGHRVHVFNRTRAKAEPLAGQGAVVLERLDALRRADVVFTMLAAGGDVRAVYFGPDGLIAPEGPAPKIVVDCSTIGVEESSALREELGARGVAYLAAPVSGNPRCVETGKLGSVVSGPRAAFDRVAHLIEIYAANGVAYVGEGELARTCKIAHNVFLAAIMVSLSEVTLLAHKAGVPRHAFLKFINRSPLGSLFTHYKTAGLVNLDFTPTFTAALLRKDVDLGLEAAHDLGVVMPIAATTREIVQAHLGLAAGRPHAEAYLQRDFAALVETMARLSGVTLEAENVPVPTGFEPED